MPVKQVRPNLDPETCSICGRRLLQGERVNWYVAPDSSSRAVCELCIPRAERVRWVREREGDEIVQMPPSRSARPGLMQRLGTFFGAGEPGEDSEFSTEAAPTEQDERRRRRAARRAREDDEVVAAEEVVAAAPIRDVAAVPTGPQARLELGVELFNRSQFPRTIAGLTRSLGDPKVAVRNVDQMNVVDIWVGWDLAWYSYRVALGDPAEPVEQSGRGNDVDELSGVVPEWNAGADGFGHLFLRSGASSDRPTAQDD
jgi:predicted Fe-S protein YdhL (DUF1289 family)